MLWTPYTLLLEPRPQSHDEVDPHLPKLFRCCPNLTQLGELSTNKGVV
jgi:hypothetical protein